MAARPHPRSLLAVVLVVLSALAGCSTSHAAAGAAPSKSTAAPDVAPEVPPAPDPTSTSSSSTTTVSPPPSYPITPAAPVGPSRGAAPVVSRVATTDPVIFLTIDDGMVRDPRVPQFLAEHRIPATLFLNAGPLKADPAYFVQFTAMGDPIESHTVSHPKLKGMRLGDQKAQVCGMNTVIDQVIGGHGHLFRPPYGAYDDTTKRAAAQCGANAVVTWRVALNDGMVQTQSGDHLRPGDIVLSHFRDDLYDNLVELWSQAQQAGLSFAPLEAYLPPPNG